MKFGVREICDVVFRAKAAQKIGNRQFYRNEPVLYFDTLTLLSFTIKVSKSCPMYCCYIKNTYL